MDREGILDEVFVKSEKDESKINKAVGIIRYMICGYLGSKYFKMLIGLELTGGLAEKISFVFGISIGVLFFIWFVYYNLKHAKLEKIQKYVFPHFKSKVIIVFLAYTLVYIIIFTRRIYLSVKADNIDTHFLHLPF